MKIFLLILIIIYNNINCGLVEMPKGEEYEYDPDVEYQVELTGGDAGCYKYHVTGATKSDENVPEMRPIISGTEKVRSES
jgi:hypothetical protein